MSHISSCCGNTCGLHGPMPSQEVSRKDCIWMSQIVTNVPLMDCHFKKTYVCMAIIFINALIRSGNVGNKSAFSQT